MPDKLKDDAVFKADCDREPRAHPELRDEFRAAVRELAETGTNEMLSRRRCLIRAAYPATPVTVTKNPARADLMQCRRWFGSR